MTDDELKEVLSLLEAQGWRPALCDAAVPYFDCGVPCGAPTDVGDVWRESKLLPREFLSLHPEFVVTVAGDSMCEAGIVAGDAVRVVADVPVHDGDIVLTMLDGEFTLKTFCEDEEGRPWLVPQNAAYDAFPLDDHPGATVVGVVTEVIRKAPRIGYRACQKSIERARRKTAAALPQLPPLPPPDGQDEVDAALVENMKPFFYGREDVARDFLRLVRTLGCLDITSTVRTWVKAGRIPREMCGRAMWQVLHKAGIYARCESNWNQQVGQRL